jgi:two-component system response regulator PilR (NtrC family)
VIQVSTRGKLLIVDDELSVRDSLGKWFREEGYEVATTENASDALTSLAQQRWDVALVDIKMHGTDGIELQRRMHEVDPELLVIMMTGYASVETAVAALKNGAYDYVTKPLDPDEISHLVTNALAHKRTAQENVLLRETVAEVARPGELIGQSAAMRKIFDAIETVGPTDATVLITGESGTGKERIARAIHDLSDRASKPFLVVNCGALPEALIESELFGHDKGAFTGAVARHLGLFREADGGTVLLDEVGELATSLQVKLLRVLQERKVRSVGATAEVSVDVRVLAATNRAVEEDVKAGKFRQDLYYRLNVIRIEVPTLSARREDIPDLAQFFLARCAAEHGKEIRGFSPDVLRALDVYSFPGNVRELENIVERAVALASSPLIGLGDLPHEVGGASARPTPRLLDLPDEGCNLDDVLGELERRLIVQALERTGGMRANAARVLGVSVRSLRYRLQKHAMEVGADVDPDSTHPASEPNQPVDEG